MKAVRLHAIGDIRCDNIEIPVPHGEELLLKVGACGVCGSDLPRTFEHGTSSGKYPLTIGHEFAGEVVAVGEKADKSLIGAKGAIFPLIPCRKCDPCVTGKYAMCENYDYLGSRSDGGFAEYCLIPSAWHLIRSQSAPMELLAMTEPACVAQHAVRRAKVTAGQCVVIFGAGPIGIMAARWVRIFGAEPILVDIVAEKVAFAKEKGFMAVNSREEELLGAIRTYNRGRLADAAIEGTGSGKALVSCVESVHAGGCISLLGNPMGNTEIPLKIHSMMLRKEVEINGVWNSSRAPYPVDEWKYTVRMMDEGKFEAADLITDRPSHEELPAILKELKDGTRKSIKVMCI
ncbi:MAG: galactitol-1-phosphate 5-dehydrogenase [Ruminococcaceae bacterium]|nr:galactitol-1-phosphate 5-dehydrogenase [Oscillospiraceae bacterium]